MDLNFLSKHTHGFFGANLTGICQRAAKLAIRQSIEADIRKARERREKEVASDVEIDEDEDEKGRRYYEVGMNGARALVFYIG